jgi:hypothetical protein
MFWFSIVCLLRGSAISVFSMQILETAFKKETVGLVTREQYVEKVFNPFHRIFLLICVCIMLADILLDLSITRSIGVTVVILNEDENGWLWEYNDFFACLKHV